MSKESPPRLSRAGVRTRINELVLGLLDKDLTTDNLTTIERLAKIRETFEDK